MSEYDNMTVAELKELLKDAGLPVSGKKADLITRLEENETHDDKMKSLTKMTMILTITMTMMIGMMMMKNTFTSPSKNLFLMMLERPL